ncbi:M50 family metallopeptidase [Bifidobacterium aquikefiricola]|uniref:M50 family metallopeptidase n=1 Tax=Bifidobacterium aquikefiricola TaxID=3059038 RepID=A0AB39U8Q7_9BIFI
MNIVHTTLHTIVESSLTQAPAAGVGTLALSLLIAICCVSIRPVWHIARNLITIIHEGGHALIALCSGRRLGSVRLHADTSGETVSFGKSHGIAYVVTAMAGYPAPAVLGIAASLLAARGYVSATLWILVALMFALLIRVRNMYGIIVIMVTASLVVGISWWADIRVQTIAAHSLAWFLILGSIRPLLELQSQRARGQSHGSDADSLDAATRIPGLVWIILWMLWSLFALWIAAAWMTRSVGGITPFAHSVLTLSRLGVLLQH